MSKNRLTVVFAIVVALFLEACSTVRDGTDWIPGVDSNEEIARKKAEEERETRRKEREQYVDKATYAPTGTAAMSDAEINVIIGQQFTADELITRDDIGIEVNLGIVTLTGSVHSDEVAIRAIAIAKNTPGVSRVISKLIVFSVRDKS